MTSLKRQKSLGKGLTAGAAGGAIASYLMNEFQQGVAHVGEKVAETEKGRHGQRAQKQAATEGRGAQPQQPEDPLSKTADIIAEATLGRRLSPPARKNAARLLHYGFGALMGGTYGMMREVTGLAGLGQGALFGLTVWALADEAALPALGLTEPPPEQPLANHVSSLVTHVFFGMATYAAARLIRRRL